VRLTLVVPCYNEERRLPVDAFARWLRDDPPAELLFVDDGSTDGTAGRIGEVVAAQPGRAALLRLERNGGKAEAVRRGMLEAMERGAQVTGFWDADLATPLDAVATFRAVLEQRPEIQWVFGARVRLLGRHIERQPLRHVAGRVFATLASYSLGLPVYDTQCGAKLFRASPALRAVLVEPFLSRWIFEVEMIARLASLPRDTGFDAMHGICEVPLTTWHDVRGSKVRPTDFLRAAGELARIRLRHGPRRTP
jgi:glycosyltransferase involved in cell wall biosynthesis